MSAPVVLKFGGSTFPTAADYHRIAGHLVEAAEESPVIAVVSAPPGLTEDFRERLTAVNPDSRDETLGGLLPRADTVGAYLLKAALDQMNAPARVLTAPELGIATRDSYVRARVESVDPEPARRALVENRIAIVPGGQALDVTGRQVWLGKNSSDFSAILLAVALEARLCAFYSDVEGVYDCDPRIVPQARALSRIGYEAALAASHAGAKVVHNGGVAHAEAHGLKVVCRLNRAPYTEGTVIGERGSETIIVPDERSRVFVFPDAASHRAALRALEGAHMPIVRTSALRRRSIAVTCGYSSPETTLREAGLPAHETGQKLLSLVAPDGDTRISLHPDTTSLLMAARHAFARARAPIAVPAPEMLHV